MLVLAKEVNILQGVPCKVLDSVTLSGHVLWRNTRYYVSSLRKMLHLVNIDWPRIAYGTEILVASHKFGMDCFSKGNVAYINDRVLISELEELELVGPRCHGIATHSLYL
jgi:hypothetical protein